MVKRTRCRIIKIRRRDGFTLTEVLATVVLVGLMSIAVTAGVGAAIRSYRGIRLKADAQTLLATTVSAFTADMGTAENVERDPDGTVSFYSGFRKCKMKYQSGNDGIKVVLTGKTETPLPLLTERTQTLDLVPEIENSGISYDPDKHYFSFTIDINKEGNTIEKQEVVIHSAE